MNLEFGVRPPAQRAYAPGGNAELIDCGLRAKRHRAKGIGHMEEFGIRNAECGKKECGIRKSEKGKAHGTR